MALNIIDIITSFLQSIVFAYTITYCMDKKEKIDKIKLLLMIIMFLFNGQFLTQTFGESWGMSIFIVHILALFIASAFYRKNIRSVVTSYTIVYFMIVLYCVIFGNLIFEYVKGTLPIEYINYEKVFILYIPQWILLFLCFKYVDKLKQIHKLIINEGFLIIFIVISFFLDFILTFYLITLGEKSQIIKNSAYIIFFLFLIVILIYFWKIHKKSEQIYKLNKALEVKNNQLSKVKHDYGAQISYLYGLCLMERFDDLKKALKDIINNNESTSTAVEISENQESLLAIALKPAVEKGIHVIIEEKCAFSSINMNEMEFYRVISNIVNNAIKAMNGKGIIIAKSYEYLGNVIIRIENNGPKIEEHHLKDIFKVGFTTKENSDNNHGFGLSIVKDLVERSNGKIYVKSTDVATEFKIILPMS